MHRFPISTIVCHESVILYVMNFFFFCKMSVFSDLIIHTYKSAFCDITQCGLLNFQLHVRLLTNKAEVPDRAEKHCM